MNQHSSKPWPSSSSNECCSSFVCVNCGKAAGALFKEYSTGVLKICYCGFCDKPVDQYIETDTSIILIDAALQRLESYRHFMYNNPPVQGWKFGLICILCDAYMKWVAQRLENGKPQSYLELEWSFYIACLHSVIENLIFFLTIFICVLLFSSEHQIQPLSMLGSLLTVAGCGKLFTIPAVLWGWDTNEINHPLITTFVLVSLIQACRALRISSRLKAITIVLSAFGLEMATSDLLKTILPPYWTFL